MQPQSNELPQVSGAEMARLPYLFRELGANGALFDIRHRLDQILDRLRGAFPEEATCTSDDTPTVKSNSILGRADDELTERRHLLEQIDIRLSELASIIGDV